MTTDVQIREIQASDRDAWCRLRGELWPEEPADHEAWVGTFFAGAGGDLRVFVAARGDELVGFLELDVRKFVPGCSSSPAPFIEGWYVAPDARGQGIGRGLMNAAEAWARAAGFTEIGSDTEIENTRSIVVHRALGYEEVERSVFFRKKL